MRKNIGDYVKTRRTELDMTQDELAALVGYKHKTSINKIELGLSDVPRSRIPAFASALRVSEPELQGYDENMGALGNLLAPDEFALIAAYRSASKDTRAAVLRVLGVR
ncbi:MAG: helix-turn-helix transcriptional regulator [Oscillospiraceae bacterium]|nr:helix-turn-helix transcriptional regulator [Oscillospiraceae bacterium]